MDDKEQHLHTVSDAMDGRERGYTLVDIFVYFWRRRLLLSFGVCIGMLLVCTYLAISQRSYTATMIITPTANGSPGGLLSVVSGLTGGSASGAAGLNGEPNLFSDFLVLFRSQEVAQLADKRYSIRQKLFSKYWNAKRHTWDMSPKSPLGFLRSILHGVLGDPTPNEPSYYQTSQILVQKVSVVADQDNNQWDVAVTDTNPAFAQWLLTVLYKTTEDYLRENLRAQTKSETSYLEKRLSEISVEDYRQALLSVLMTREKSLMVTESSGPVAARLVQPAVVSDAPTAPVIGLFLAIGFLVSFILTTVLLVFHDWYMEARAKAKGMSSAQLEQAFHGALHKVWRSRRILRRTADERS